VPLGRTLMLAGALVFALGLVFSLLGGRGSTWRLPGDIVYRRGNVTIYVPIVTCILVSMVLTLLFRLFRR
jgi:hypothetical protein